MELKKTFALSFFILLAFAALAASQVNPTSTSPSLSDAWQIGGTYDWMGFALLAVLACFFFVSLVYMASVIIQNDTLKRWAQGELLQAVASGFLVIFLIAIISTVVFQSICLTQPDLCSSGAVTRENTLSGVSPYTPVHDKINKAKIRIEMLYMQVLAANAPIEAAEHSCVIFFGVEMYCGWDLHPTVERAHFINWKLSELQIVMDAELTLIEIVQNSMLNILLPLGIILRILPLTRGIGGLLIAIAIGFYIVYPVFFMVSTFNLTTVAQIGSASTLLGFNPNEACYGDVGGADRLLKKGFEQANAVNPLYTRIGADIPMLYMEYVIQPFIILAITIMFVRAATPILGGDSTYLIQGVSKLV
ncbi:Uncharacterised protein [Candidatus Gugararchaeum adminiculabundum]|nr:Uncharacterised protein [Candidatus Gugararchaeum adminiculabundum]